MTARDHIINWLTRVSERGGKIEKEDIVFLMVQARHLAEDNPEKTKYKVVEFYCSWIVHTKLDRPSDITLAIFKDITSIISANWNLTGSDVVAQISKVVGLSNLRAELISLFQENNLPIELFGIYENWKGLIGILTYFLQNKLLVFPDEGKVTRSKFKTLIKEIITFEKPADFWIKNISIIGTNSRPHWCLELGGEKDTTKIEGELFIEKDNPI